MFCGLGEEERTKFRKKKKRKKKEIKGKKRNKPHRGQKWVAWDERVSQDIQPYEIFFAVLKPFLTETAFYAELAGRFSGFKSKVTRPIASKFGTNIQLINLKLLSKFHVARTKPFSSYKQKSEILHSLVEKWPSKNKGTCDASVGRSNSQAQTLKFLEKVQCFCSNAIWISRKSFHYPCYCSSK